MTGKEVRRIREARRETQRQFSEIVGVTETTVWRWENEWSRVSPPVARLIKTLEPAVSAA
jgi:DNA-binding transcriptional regulator YiaG